MINYYHILGVSQNASGKELKEAYRKLAVRYHPDKNPGSSYAEERFKEISHAYQILSNPQKKAQHDHSLAYAAFKRHSAGTTYRQAPAPPPPPPYAYESPQQRAWRRRYGSAAPPRPMPSVTSRQNLVATAWAFGFFLILSMIVLGLTSYQSYHEEQERARQEEIATEIFRRAEDLFLQNNYARSLQLLNSVDQQSSASLDTKHLRQKIFRKLEEEANRSFEQGNFPIAAIHYQLLVDHSQVYNALIYAKLVSSYELIPDYQQAIRTYLAVLNAEPLSIEARVRMAALLYELGEHEKALNYYEEASEIVTREYQDYYGKAYALVVNPEKTPPNHYHLHCGLGLVYSQLSRFKEAHAALKWAIFLRPDEPDAYFLMGNNLWKEGRSSEACQKWEEAREKGSEEAYLRLKEHCR